MPNEKIVYGLILADDVLDPEKALEVAKVAAPYMDATKLSVANSLKNLGLISKVKEATKKPVIVDFKVADIGFLNEKNKEWEGTNGKTVSTLIDAGADYVTCQTFPGTSSIQECVEVAHSLGGKILTLPYMTHRGADVFFDQPINLFYTKEKLEELGIAVDVKRCDTISDLILVLGEYFKVDGYIGPANNPKKLSRYRQFTAKTIDGPGIGRQVIGDLTPQKQLKIFYDTCKEDSGAIIGSAIYGSPKNPDLANVAESAKTFRLWRNQICDAMYQ
jgi:orotidine-5'-phosphate decarboxylase